jgi:hypothetical protein
MASQWHVKHVSLNGKQMANFQIRRTLIFKNSFNGLFAHKHLQKPFEILRLLGSADSYGQKGAGNPNIIPLVIPW